jgi:hypothetical protein
MRPPATAHKRPARAVPVPSICTDRDGRFNASAWSHPHLIAHGGPQWWGEAFLGLAKKSKNSWAYNQAQPSFDANDFFSFVYIGIYNRSNPFNINKTLSPSSSAPYLFKATQNKTAAQEEIILPKPPYDNILWAFYMFMDVPWSLYIYVPISHFF